MQIQDGLVNVENNSTQVVASDNADWSSLITALAQGTPVFFSLLGLEQIVRQVSTVTTPALSGSGNWELNLVTPWDKATQSGAAYAIHKDFTPNKGYPLPSPGDRQMGQLFSRAFMAMDALSEERIVLLADLTGTSSGTLISVTGLVFTLKSGVNYGFEFGLLWSSSATGAGPKIGITRPTNTVYAANVRIPAIAANGTDAEITGPLNVNGDSVTATTSKAASTVFEAYIKGSIKANAGALQVIYAAGGTGTITPKSGSWGRLWYK